jgi:hypothetical protein
MRINGWQRLWLLTSVLWAVVILALAGILRPAGDHLVPTARDAALVARLWLVPVVAVYVLGLGVNWVRRGFRVERE